MGIHGAEVARRTAQRYDDCQESAAANQARPQTPFGELEDAVARVAMFAQHLRKVADQLVGERPPMPETGAKNIALQPGLIGLLANRAENLRYAMAQALEDLNRIEQQLP